MFKNLEEKKFEYFFKGTKEHLLGHGNKYGHL